MLEVVCAVISDARGRILACRRGEGRHLGGLWEFPGGKVDAGESHSDALRRELQEELGIIVSVGNRLSAQVEWADGDVSIRLSAFHCKIIHGRAMALEHSEILWCDLSGLAALDWAEADLPILAEISGGFSGDPS
ncbi:(deoxy)nucleoside triphosphate pyrophosphohydrolase [Akkermansiaceae bacterium]|nr:(deoxy)nucleoside triphosphate pyrophosphohydrolase [Akkermansiaceae bacterium]